MYCDNQLIIAVNTEKCEQNSIEAKENFDSIINSFLDEYRIESIQPFGMAAGNPVVYSGPSKNGYATVESVSSNELITLLSTSSTNGFNYCEYSSSNGTKRGYVARYALELGYQVCLFEFLGDTIATNFNNGKYEDYFINSIKYLIEI